MNLAEALRAKQQQTEHLVTLLGSDSQDDTPDTEEPVVSEEEAEEETVEHPDDIEKDVDPATEEVEDAEDTVAGTEDLQNLLDGLVAAQRRGGLTAVDAMFAQDLAAAGARHMGVKFEHQSIDMQSFQTSSDRAEYTALALEGVKSAVSNGWKKFIEHVKKIFASVVNFIKRWVFSWGRLQARAKSLIEKINKVAYTQNTAKNTISNPKIIAKIYKKGGSNITQQVSNDAALIIKVYQEMFETTMGLSMVTDLSKEGEAEAHIEKLKAHVNNINTALDDLPELAPKVKAEAEGGIKGFFKLKPKAAKVDLPATIPALTMREAGTVCTAISKLAVTRASKMRDENKKLAELPKTVEKIIATKNADDSNKAAAEFLTCYPLFARGYLVMSGWSTSYASAVLDYVEASIRAATEAGKAAATAAP